MSLLRPGDLARMRAMGIAPRADLVAAYKTHVAPQPLEHLAQVALFDWARIEAKSAQPLLRWLHAIPNGGFRNKGTAGKMKAEGVTSGVLDVFLPVVRGRYHGLYVEMKSPDGSVSANQADFASDAQGQGYACVVCFEWTVARDLILRYLALGAGESNDYFEASFK